MRPILALTIAITLTSLSSNSVHSPRPVHRWLCSRCPDPEGTHFKAVVEAVTALQNWLIDEDAPKAGKPFYVWLDYVSIPQANQTLQSLSISSLALYASMPDYFLVVAPPATHVETRRACDTETYLRRGWYSRLMFGTKPPRFRFPFLCPPLCTLPHTHSGAALSSGRVSRSAE